MNATQEVELGEALPMSVGGYWDSFREAVLSEEFLVEATDGLDPETHAGLTHFARRVFYAGALSMHTIMMELTKEPLIASAVLRSLDAELDTFEHDMGKGEK